MLKLTSYYLYDKHGNDYNDIKKVSNNYIVSLSVTIKSDYITLIFDLEEVDKNTWNNFINNIKNKKKTILQFDNNNGGCFIECDKNIVTFSIVRCGNDISVKFKLEECIDIFERIDELYTFIN